MSKMVWILAAGLLFGSCAAKESKYMARQQYRVNADQGRMARENYKQRKQMEKESRRANRGSGYDVNSMGNVFKGL